MTNLYPELTDLARDAHGGRLAIEEEERRCEATSPPGPPIQMMPERSPVPGGA